MKRILVVDDEKDVCTYRSRLFEENGYAVASVTDGSEALQKVQDERPHLVALDLSMPGTSGIRVYREIKTRPDLCNIPVILVTGVTGFGGNPRDTERFLSTRRQVPPPDGFIVKPIDWEEIIALVKRLIGPSETGVGRTD